MKNFSIFVPNTRLLDKFPVLISVIILLSFLAYLPLQAQSVSVGVGSYSTTLSSGQAGPQRANGGDLLPKISNDFSLPVQTNDFWSSLIFPFFGDPYSNVLYVHPLTVKALSNGLQMGNSGQPVLAGSDYFYPYSPQLSVGIEGMNASETVTAGYGDWTVEARWTDNSKVMEATFGHGLPFVFLKISGGNALVTPYSDPVVWYQNEEVMGITLNGVNYGLFAPDGSTWSGSGTFQSSLNGKGFLTVALLPDNTEATLQLFRKHAYAFVTNSLVSWNYEESTADLTTSYTYETVLMDTANNNLNETLTAMYRHQWLNTDQELTDHRYASPNGVMKVFEGNTFSTQLKFSGILPAMPDQGDYNREQLLGMLQETAQEDLVPGPTYENGKAMGRFAQLVNIADQLGATAERDYFISKLKTRLEDWFTAGGAQEYVYNEDWNVLTGYPSGFGADNQINDHHFHASYAIQSAATVAQFDPVWASQSEWGGMVNLLIKDANNWDRNDTMFPFLRSHDAYTGHSWAAGHGDFGDGNNQESSSESMNFASAVMLWGSVTGQEEIRDLGIFLHTNERTAIEQYWFDVDDEVFPETYPHVALGIVWGGKRVHSTWFGNDPEFIHGINFLPIGSGSLYLGRHPEYVKANYAKIVEERGGQPVVWKDVLWEFLALADADQALAYYNADLNYQPFDGESRAHTYHWLYNLKKMGTPDTTTFADIPTFSVFKDAAGNKTYSAFNPGSVDREVMFSDAFNMTVPAGEMRTMNNSSVANEGITGIPEQTSLSPNYPNPFNPTTEITVSLSMPSKVTLEIFNVLGQKVATLMQNQALSAGPHTMSFDARSLSSGVYVYRMVTSGGFIKSRKMMLIK